jgi:hypothetical protein
MRLNVSFWPVRDMAETDGLCVRSANLIENGSAVL